MEASWKHARKIALVASSLSFVALGSWQLLAGHLRTQGKAFDFAKINASLKSATQKFSNTSTTVKSLHLALQPEASHPEQDQYSLEFAVNLYETPWSLGKEFSAEGSIQSQIDLANPAEKGLSFQINTRKRTDTLAMLRYKATKYSHCEAAAQASGLKGLLWQRHCEYVAKLSQIGNVTDLGKLLQEKIAAHLSDLRVYQASLQSLLDQGPSEDGTVQGLLRSQLADLKTASEFLSSAVVTETDTGFNLQLPAFTACPLFATTPFSLVVTADTLQIAGGLKLNFGKAHYQAARPVIFEFLEGLEDGEEFALKYVDFKITILANLLQQAIDAVRGKKPGQQEPEQPEPGLEAFF